MPVITRRVDLPEVPAPPTHQPGQTPEPPHPLSISDPSEHATEIPSDLRCWNIVLFLLHSTFAIVSLVPENVNLTLYSTPVQPFAVNGTWGVVPGGEASTSTLSLKFLIFSFFAVTALAHASYGILFRSEYETNVRQCKNPYRWIEYGTSASIMAVSIAYFCTIIWRSILLSIFALTATTMGYGYVTEVIARPKGPDEWLTPLSGRLAPHLIGYFPLIVAFWIIGGQFFYAAGLTSEGGGQMPSFVYYIVGTQFVGFFSFGFVQLATLLSKPSSFGRYERLYCILSAVVKSILGLIIFTQVLFASGAVSIPSSVTDACNWLQYQPDGCSPTSCYQTLQFCKEFFPDEVQSCVRFQTMNITGSFPIIENAATISQLETECCGTDPKEGCNGEEGVSLVFACDYDPETDVVTPLSAPSSYCEAKDRLQGTDPNCGRFLMDETACDSDSLCVWKPDLNVTQCSTLGVVV